MRPGTWCSNAVRKPGKTEKPGVTKNFEKPGSGLDFCPHHYNISPMSRPLRIEFPGAIYHVTSRGDRREPIFEDDSDRAALLGVLEEGMQRFDAQVLAYYLMGNHYHSVLHTRRANLSRLMRHLNGVYTQAYNRRHGKVGHLFQGRFKAILVDRDAYLLEVCRYVELNPVRSRMVAGPGDGAVGRQPAPGNPTWATMPTRAACRPWSQG